MTPGDADHGGGDSPTRADSPSIPADTRISPRAVINSAGDIRRPVRLDGFDTTIQGPDLSRPNAARVYDYFLGGGLNYGIDQEFAREAMAIFPAIKAGARDNRGFLGRAVRYMAGQGVRQFLDLGCGIPSVGSSWEIATRACLDARVVCVDNEPVAVHATEDAIRKEPERHKHVDVIQADFTDPDAVLRHPFVRGVLDLDRPVAVLMVAVLHFVPGDQPLDLIKQYMSRTPAGSYLAVSVAASDDAPLSQQAQLDQFVKKYENTNSPLYLRRRDEVRRWFDGLELVSPMTGAPDRFARLVHLDEWMPDDTGGMSPLQVSDAHGCAWCGVARKAKS